MSHPYLNPRKDIMIVVLIIAVITLLVFRNFHI